MDETFCPLKNAISLEFFPAKERAYFMLMQSRSQLFCEKKKNPYRITKISFCSRLEMIKKGFLLSQLTFFFYSNFN